MGQINRALGGGSQLEHNGEVYTLSPWSYDIQSRYERYLESEAMKVVKRMELDPEEKRDLIRQVQKDIATGLYSFGNELVQESMKCVRHLTHLLWLMLLPNHPNATLSLAQEVVNTQLGELMEKVAEANSAGPTAATPPG